jgi:hypothetical protein
LTLLTLNDCKLELECTTTITKSLHLFIKISLDSELVQVATCKIQDGDSKPEGWRAMTINALLRVAIGKLQVHEETHDGKLHGCKGKGDR